MAEGSVITEKGRALLGKILATNSTLNITGAQTCLREPHPPA